MNTGIVLGIATSIVAIFCNVINLYSFRDFSTGTNEGVPVKHWVVTYILSWFIAVIPFGGIVYEILFAMYNTTRPGYVCTSKLFKEI